MNGFINHIINRHLKTDNNIVPRIPGRFEQLNQKSQGFEEISTTDQNINNDNLKEAKIENSFQKSESHTDNKLTSDIPEIHDQYKQTLSHQSKEIINNNANANLVANYNEEPQKKNDKFILSDDELQENNFDRAKKADEELLEPQDKKTNVNQSSFLKDSNDIEFKKNKIELNPVSHSLSQINPSQGQKHFTVNNFALKENESHNELPVIKVSIGRIDVRAIVSTQAEKKTGNAIQKPSMTLDDYLKKRNRDKE